MNTNLNTFATNHAAYEAMILSENEFSVDPVLMEDYVDNLQANSKALAEQSEDEKAKDARENFVLDLPIYGAFAGAFIGTVVIGYKALEITEWLSSFII